MHADLALATGRLSTPRSGLPGHRLVGRLKHFGVVVAAAWAFIATQPASASAPRGVDAVLAAAHARNLAEHPYWLRLLHYQKGLWGRPKSQADGRAFFMAPTGSHDPATELDATLRAFFTPQLSDNASPARCRFPARYAWLDEVLDLASETLPEPPCTEYVAWRDAMDAAAVTLVFASSYMSSPGSMYGHTFLRVDKAQHPHSDLLANVVSYTVNPTTFNPFAYTVRGLTGGFEGRFQAMPYYVKVQEYGNFESRDLWEYRLDLTPAEIDRMMQHIWELDATHFDYYFLDENCSYHLLALLEVARPSLALLKQFPLYTIPMDTVRAVLDAPGLVTQRHYRPSLASRMRAIRGQLTPAEARLAAHLVDRGAPTGAAPWDLLRPLAQTRQAAVMEGAQAYLAYHHGTTSSVRAEKLTAKEQTFEHDLQVHRSDLDAPALRATIPEPAAPEQGHASSRVAVGAGMDTRAGAFATVEGRFALHDLLDPQTGYIADSELIMGQLRLRVTPQSPHLESFDVVRLIALTPSETWMNRASWRVSLRWGRPLETPCMALACTAAQVTGGPGWAVTTRLLGRETFYAFGDLDLGAGPAFVPNYRILLGASAGVLMNVGERVRCQGEVSVLRELVGDRASRDTWLWRAIVGQNIALADAYSLRLWATHAGAENNVQVGVLAYL